MVEARAGFTALHNQLATAKSIATSAAKSLWGGVWSLLPDILKPKVYPTESYTVAVSETPKQAPPEKAPVLLQPVPQPVPQHARNEVIVQMSTIPQTIELTLISNPPAEIIVKRPVSSVPLLTMPEVAVPRPAQPVPANESPKVDIPKVDTPKVATPPINLDIPVQEARSELRIPTVEGATNTLDPFLKKAGYAAAAGAGVITLVGVLWGWSKVKEYFYKLVDAKVEEERLAQTRTQKTRRHVRDWKPQSEDVVEAAW